MINCHDYLLWIDFPPNRFHPLVCIKGNVEIGEGTFIGFLSEVNGVESRVEIGKGCDIASFVSINCADSHKRCIDRAHDIERRGIKIGDRVFIGSHSFIKGGAIIENNCVVAAGTIVEPGFYPSWSLIYGNPCQVKEGYYKKQKHLSSLPL